MPARLRFYPLDEAAKARRGLVEPTNPDRGPAPTGPVFTVESWTKGSPFAVPAEAETRPVMRTTERLWTPEGVLAYGEGSDVPIEELPGLVPDSVRMKEARRG
jgi:hypothetical protein